MIMHAAIRTYIRELRKRRNVSQKELADHIGLSLRAFSDWETGKSDDLKAMLFIKAILFLNGSWNDIVDLVEHADNEVGEGKAIEYAKGRMPEYTLYANGDTEDVMKIMQELRDPQFRNAFLIFWSGWKACGASPLPNQNN